MDGASSFLSTIETPISVYNKTTHVYHQCTFTTVYTVFCNFFCALVLSWRPEALSSSDFSNSTGSLFSVALLRSNSTGAIPDLGCF